jgi:beta-phosphoglucomutase-like phosphatase (HAD superfamily)
MCDQPLAPVAAHERSPNAGSVQLAEEPGDPTRAKPNPHLYLAALELLDVPASETFAVEDSPNGIRAAKAAGIPCVCVPNEATEGLDLSEADLVVPTFEGLAVDNVWRRVRRPRSG